MVKLFAYILAICPLTGIMAADNRVDPAKHYWAQWRGPLATGVAPYANPPTEWDEDKNIRWKIQLPGIGHSTPVVWDDHIFITTAIPDGDLLEPKYSGGIWCAR